MSSSRRHGHTRYSRGSCYRASRDAPIDKMVETYYTCPPLADTRHSRTHTRLLQPGHHRARLGSTGTQKRNPRSSHRHTNDQLHSTSEHPTEHRGADAAAATGETRTQQRKQRAPTTAVDIPSALGPRPHKPPRRSSKQRLATNARRRPTAHRAPASTRHTVFALHFRSRQQARTHGPTASQSALRRRPGTLQSLQGVDQKPVPIKFGLHKPNHYTWYQAEPMLWRFINEKPSTEPPPPVDIPSLLKQTSDFMQHHPPRGTPGQQQTQPQGTQQQGPGQQPPQPAEHLPTAPLPEPQQQPAPDSKEATAAAAEAEERLSQGAPQERRNKDRRIPQPLQPPRLGGGSPAQAAAQQTRAPATDTETTQRSPPTPTHRPDAPHEQRASQPPQAAAKPAGAGQSTQTPKEQTDPHRDRPPQQPSQAVAGQSTQRSTQTPKEQPTANTARQPPQQQPAAGQSSPEPKGRTQSRRRYTRSSHQTTHRSEQQRHPAGYTGEKRPPHQRATTTTTEHATSRHPATSRQCPDRCGRHPRHTPPHTRREQSPQRHAMGSQRHPPRATHVQPDTFPPTLSVGPSLAIVAQAMPAGIWAIFAIRQTPGHLMTRTQPITHGYKGMGLTLFVRPVGPLTQGQPMVWHRRPSCGREGHATPKRGTSSSCAGRTATGP